MITTLIICIPITALVVGFLVLKSVHLGLKWQFQAKQEQPPTFDSPIQPIIDKMEQKQQVKQVDEQASILHEYLNGAEER
jgi:hypothetical protein